jgi:hypothetical protein
MSQTEGDKSSQPATARAEELLGHLGHDIGSLAARLRDKVGHLAQPAPVSGEQPDQPGPAKAEGGLLDEVGYDIGSLAARLRDKASHPIQPAQKPEEQPDQPEAVHAEETGQPQVMQKAEKLVDEMAQRVGEVSSRVSLQTRKITARVGEEVEDMWAEAQQIRSRGRGK